MEQDGSPDPQRVTEALVAVGTLLREARERQGRSLETIATATHIRLVYLSALEAGELRSLPGQVFIKGFLRSYGNEVGLDGEAVVAEYRDRLAPQTEGPPGTPTRRRRGRRSPRRRLRFLRSVIVFVLLVAAIVWVVHALTARRTKLPHLAARSSVTRTAQGAAQSIRSVVSSAPQAVIPAPVVVNLHWGTDATNGQAMGTYSVMGAASLDVVVSVSAACWTEQWVGGQLVTDNTTLEAGKSYTWTGTAPILLYAGNPGGLHVTVNGIAQPALSGTTPEYLDFTLVSSGK